MLQRKIETAEANLTTVKVVQGRWDSCFEPVLAQNRIDRQAYHSGAFAGNHIHKALQQEVISAIVSVLITAHCRSWFHIHEHKRCLSQYMPDTVIFLLCMLVVDHGLHHVLTELIK